MDEITIALLLTILVSAYLIFRPGSGNFSGDGSTSGFSDQLVLFAHAINMAEQSGVVPPTNNNPGNLKVNSNLSSLLTQGWTGQSASNGISIYDSPGDGWNALYYQLLFIVNGQSNLANLGDTISDLAYNYTATSPDDWANNVASYLAENGAVDSNGNPVTPDTPLGDVLS